jgi:L-alanine-DL-glutamate epimerase-like enolase superfamily enzyme
VDLEAFRLFMEAGAIDVFQGDMNRFGFDGILMEAAQAAEHGQRVAQHNWGSLVGFYMQLHVGRAVANFYRAEHDPLTTEVLVADGVRIEEGAATVSDVPGCGLVINERAFANDAKDPPHPALHSDGCILQGWVFNFPWAAPQPKRRRPLDSTQFHSLALCT